MKVFARARDRSLEIAYICKTKKKLTYNAQVLGGSENGLVPLTMS